MMVFVYIEKIPDCVNNYGFVNRAAVLSGRLCYTGNAETHHRKDAIRLAPPYEVFPDGTPIDPWFYNTRVPALSELGRSYLLTDYGILDDGRLHTAEIQALIDTAAREGGGVIVVPAGTYLTGALFFRQGVNLYLAPGATLKGSDDIADYPLCPTRIEGESCTYFAALINADGLDGFTICGPGAIDGNGLRSWQAFWLRRGWNPDCTNKDEQRPRLIYLSHCRNVLVAEVRLQNAHFWTNHIYKSHHIKYIGCRIFSPSHPVKAPSTDAIDIDACTDFLIKGCYFEVNDDAVVLKGGKGPWADTLPENGPNQRILIEDCTYGFCHGCLTFGSECIHSRNVLLRRVTVDTSLNFLWFKMRPDTPQLYEYVAVEDARGTVDRFFNMSGWNQFFDPKGRQDIPISQAAHVVLRRCDFTCQTCFEMPGGGRDYQLDGLTLEDITVQAQGSLELPVCVQDPVLHNVQIAPLRI